jgi:hypothetical protein
MFPTDAEIVTLKVKSSWYEQTAAALAFLVYCIDPAIDEQTLYEDCLDALEESEGEFTFLDLKALAILARSTKFNEKFDVWQ